MNNTAIMDIIDQTSNWKKNGLFHPMILDFFSLSNVMAYYMPIDVSGSDFVHSANHYLR